MTKKSESQPSAAVEEEGGSSFRLLNDLHSDLRVILELLEQHDVRDFRLEKGDERISLKRGKDESPAQGYSLGYNGNPNGYSQSLPQVNQMPFSQPPFGALSGAGTNGGPQTVLNVAVHPSAGETIITPNKSYKEVTSPMVGTFYRRPAVDAEPYAEVGDIVKKGDVLCIVEAMKLMNEIESDMNGRVVEVCLDDAQMVEYGEVLFRIEPV